MNYKKLLKLFSFLLNAIRKWGLWKCLFFILQYSYFLFHEKDTKTEDYEAVYWSKTHYFKAIYWLLTSSKVIRLNIDYFENACSVYLKNYIYPIYIRMRTSDLILFYEIFLKEEYSFLSKKIVNPRLILDCGANVGYSSVYFLNQYPNAKVIAVEPDSGNYQLCLKNLKFYQNRFIGRHAGVWSHSANLVVVRGLFGDGMAWSFQVRECYVDEKPDVKGFGIADLLEQSDCSRIDILKMDIEKSEIEVFSKNYETWLDKASNIIIELHGEECKRVFFSAMKNYYYDLSSSGKLTLCTNIQKR